MRMRWTLLELVCFVLVLLVCTEFCRPINIDLQTSEGLVDRKQRWSQLNVEPTLTPTPRPSRSRRPTPSPTFRPTIVPYTINFQVFYTLFINSTVVVLSQQSEVERILREQSCGVWDFPSSRCSCDQQCLRDTSANPTNVKSRDVWTRSMLRVRHLENTGKTEWNATVSVSVPIASFPEYETNAKALHNLLTSKWLVQANVTSIQLTTALVGYNAVLFSDVVVKTGSVSNFTVLVNSMPTLAPTTSSDSNSIQWKQAILNILNHRVYFIIIIAGASCLVFSAFLYLLWYRYFRVKRPRRQLDKPTNTTNSTPAVADSDFSFTTSFYRKKSKRSVLNLSEETANSVKTLPNPSSPTFQSLEANDAETLRVIEAIKQRDVLRKNRDGREMWLKSISKEKKTGEDDHTENSEEDELSGDPVVTLQMNLDDMLTQEKLDELMFVDNRRATRQDQKESKEEVKTVVVKSPEKATLPTLAIDTSARASFYQKYNSNAIHGQRLQSQDTSNPVSPSASSTNNFSSKKVKFHLADEVGSSSIPVNESVDNSSTNPPPKADLDYGLSSPSATFKTDTDTSSLLTNFRSSFGISRSSFYEKYASLGKAATDQINASNNGSVSSTSLVQGEPSTAPEVKDSRVDENISSLDTPRSLSSISTDNNQSVTHSVGLQSSLRSGAASFSFKPRPGVIKRRDSIKQFAMKELTSDNVKKDGFDPKTKEAIKASLKETYAMIKQAKVNTPIVVKKTLSMGETEFNISRQVRRPSTFLNATKADDTNSPTSNSPTKLQTRTMSFKPFQQVIAEKLTHNLSSATRSKESRLASESEDEQLHEGIDKTLIAMIDSDYRDL